MVDEQRRLYVAVYLAESTAAERAHTPLFEESFVLVRASSLEEAHQCATEKMHSVEPLHFKNALGYEVGEKVRLVEVGEVVDQSLEDGSELFSRFFRNGDAYRQLEFEDFEKDSRS